MSGSSKNIFKKTISCLSLLVLTSCTKIGLSAINFPTYFTSAEVFKNITFDKNHDLALDIYAPEKAQGAEYPVVVFFYGGRWTDGKKEQYRFAADRFVKKGYVVVIPDYRKYPDVKFPAFVEDGASAVKWVHQNITQYGGDPSRIFISGHSAGAHIGALLVADENYLKNEIKVSAYAGLAGPYSFTPDEEDLEDIFGPPENYPKMQVTTFINGGEPPMLLQHGSEDTIVGAFNHEKLANAINKHDGDVSVITYPDYDHLGLLVTLAWAKDVKGQVINDIDRFFTKHGKNKQQNLLSP